MAMTPRACVRTAIDGGIAERLPTCDSYWNATIARWRAEGLPANVPPFEHFGIDHCTIRRRPECHVATHVAGRLLGSGRE